MQNFGHCLRKMPHQRSAFRLLRRAASSQTFLQRFEAKAALHWTANRVQALTAGKDYPLAPDKPGVPALLRVLGFLDAEAQLAPTALRKYKQINALFSVIEDALAHTLRTSGRGTPLRLLELCAGQSHLSLLIAFAGRQRWEKPVHVVAVDRDQKRVALAEERASLLGLADSVRYRHSAIEDLGDWPTEYARLFPPEDAAAARARGTARPHAVFALHACDVATDHALRAGIASEAALLAVAPCCQAELAAKWARRRSSQPAGGFSLVHRVPHLRRETAAHITDALRVALLRAHGFGVTASEFVPVEHSPKNRLIVATRGALSAEQSDEAWDEYDALCAATGGAGILLEELLAPSRAALHSEDAPSASSRARKHRDHGVLFSSARR